MFQDCVGFTIWAAEADRDGNYTQPIELTIKDVRYLDGPDAPVVAFETLNFQLGLTLTEAKQATAILQEMIARSEREAE